MTTERIIKVLRAAAAVLEAGDVRSLRPGGPTVTIGGQKYVLSSDGGPLGDREDDDKLEDHPRIIRTPGGDKYRYLWALDRDKDTLAMWRVSDGNEKHWGTAAEDAGTVRKLDKKGQLNRVSHADFVAIDKHMRKVEDELMRALEKSIDDDKDDVAKAIDKAAQSFFDERVRAKMERAVGAVNEGAVPLGWKHDPQRPPEHEHRSKVNHAMESVLRREFTLNQFEDYCREQGIDLEQAGLQDTDWALKDMVYKIAEEFLP